LVRSCVINGEAVACDESGLSIFERLRWRHRDRDVFAWCFDLLELDGRDMRREPIEARKGALARLLRRTKVGLQFNEHITVPGDIVLRHACKLGLEGIVSKRLGSRYVSGRSTDWLKFKNPSHPAVQREFEEDWERRGGGDAGLPAHAGEAAMPLILRRPRDFERKPLICQKTC
jgi:ATP-dependent DNA ligase